MNKDLTPGSPAPFSRFEWMIAWRYVRARRAEGGVSVITWISLIGITLAVFALVATLAIRSGFRADFVDAILGANAHATIYQSVEEQADGSYSRLIGDPAPLVEAIRAVPGVTRAAPIVRGQVMASAGNYNAGVEVYGISAQDLAAIPGVAASPEGFGDLARFDEGVAIGSGVARELGITVGDTLRLISPNGTRTAFGTSPRVSAYEVVYIFSAGYVQIDRTRLFMPLSDAQVFFNKDGMVDEIEVMVDDPEAIDDFVLPLLQAAGDRGLIYTWQDSVGAYLRALTVEDNVMFVLMSILVLIAAMNIISGLVMLVKNKGRDIGILRTMGLSEGSILRIFFLCGAGIGTVATILGVVLGCLFAIYIDPVFSLINYLSGGGVWDPNIRGIYQLPALLRWEDVAKSAALSLGLSWVITFFPARRAARMNPVEALRYE